jgi:hypothetical protein
MRAFTLILLTAGSLALMGCPPDDTPTDPPDGDADTDTDADGDTDSDTDTDVYDVGDDIANAYDVEFDADGYAGIAETIGEAGDRDFYFVNPEAGTAIMAFTASYIYDEDGEPDTVMRLYDADGTFLGENDDFPYWSWGTDSSMFFQAYDAAGYYVEVLEWGDWADGYDGSGGSTWDYEVHFSQLDLGEYEWGANDSAAEAEASYDESVASSEDDLWYYWWLFGDVATDQTYALQTFGELEAAGDVDWFVFDVDSKSVGNYLHVSFWQDYTGMLEPLMTVYSPMGDVLAQTTEPGYTTGSALWYYDPGCTVKVTEEGRYFVAIEDANGGGGAGEGFFYPLIFSGPWFFNSDPWEIEENNPTGLANTVAMSESTNTPGYYYGGFAGALDSDTDESDNYKVLSNDTNGLEGKYLSVYVETAMHGSLLDAVITIYEDTGGATFVELATASIDPSGGVDDPAIHDLELDNDNNIYIEIVHESGQEDADASHFYFGEAIVYDSPVNE